MNPSTKSNEESSNSKENGGGGSTSTSFQLIHFGKHAPKPVPSGTGPKFTNPGPCVICGTPTSTKCMECSTKAPESGRPVPHYCCRDHQKQAWDAGHKKHCGLTRRKNYAKYTLLRRPVDHLAKCIADDCLPLEKSPCYKPYGFSKCSNEREELQLLTLYAFMIRILETDLVELQEAASAGGPKLAEFIQKEYELCRPDPIQRGQMEWFTWFQEHPNVFGIQQ